METENGRNSESIETVLKEPINQDSKTLDDLQCPILSCSATRAGIQDLEVTSNITMRNFEDQVLTANEEKGKWIFFCFGCSASPPHRRLLETIRCFRLYTFGCVVILSIKLIRV